MRASMIKPNVRALVRAVLSFVWTLGAVASAGAQTIAVYRQMCDASAAVARQGTRGAQTPERTGVHRREFGRSVPGCEASPQLEVQDTR